MENINRHCLLLFAFVFAFHSLFPQEEATESSAKSVKNNFDQGYIVALHGDTTYGYMRILDDFASQRKVKFIDDYGVSAKYDPTRLKAYGVEGRDYESLPTPINFSGLFSDSSIFLLRTYEGPASLYRFFTRRSVFTLKQGAAYIDLIKKPDGNLYEVSYNFKWERIADAFTDFPELADAIRGGLFKPEDMDRILQRYNTWFAEHQLNK